MIAKRGFDIIAAAGGLLLTAPVSAAAALAVKLESPGPVLFTQERVGLGGRPFRIHKFRTMRVGVPGASVTGAADPRITRVGAILRKSKIDELPQLWDVLRGRMSIVGPRPEVAKYVDQWPDDARRVILSVRPGITDPATLMLRNEQDLLAEQADPEKFYVSTLLPQKAAMYVDYVRRQSMANDWRLVWQTLRAVISD